MRFRLRGRSKHPSTEASNGAVVTESLFILDETLTFSAAFVAGLLSFFSPCILPLIPAYFTFITGLSLEELTGSPAGRIRRRVIMAFLEVGKRVQVREKPTHVLGTVLVGMAFGAGWSPCIGPMLGSILIMAGSEESVLEGIGLLTVYSAGLWIPFLLMSIFINYMLVFLKRTRRVLQYINVAAGTLLIGLGIALVLDRFGMLWSLIAPAAG